MRHGSPIPRSSRRRSSRGDLRVVLDRGRHRPADRLDILGRQVSGDREEAVLLRGIENRQLAAFQRIPLIGIDLAHHVDQRIAGGDQQSRLAIGRKIHVAGQESLAKCAADGLFAHVLHIERRLALPLRHQHPSVEGPQNHHMAQALEQFFVAQEAGPGSDRLTVPIEHPNDRIGEVADGFRIGIHVRPRHRSRRRDPDIGEIGRPPGRTAGSGTWRASGA